MNSTLDLQDLRNLIASVNICKALVRKFEEKPFTVGSANSSVKMFSSLIELFESPLSKLSMKEMTLVADGLGTRSTLSAMNKEFSTAFVNANEDEVLPSALVSTNLQAYKKLLEAVQVVVALYSEVHSNEIHTLTEREINAVDECRAVYTEYMKKYDIVDEAMHYYNETDPDASLSKEVARAQNKDVHLNLSTDPSNKTQISADFRVRD